MRNLILIATLLSLLYSCKPTPDFAVKGLELFSNFEFKDTLRLDMNLDQVIEEGIVVPNEAERQAFEFNFELSQTSDSTKIYYYKLFYQNQSYKYPEFDEDGKYNPLSAKNFYGSWVGASEGFRATPLIPNNGKPTSIKDSFQIVGNPRDEVVYFGSDGNSSIITEEEIEAKRAEAFYNPEWMEQIGKKAMLNNISAEEQLDRDVIWIIRESHKQGNSNNRWKRNPRVGNYEFLLVICDDEGLKSIPDHIQNIGLLDSEMSTFYNPFAWFKQHSKKGLIAVDAPQALNLKATLDGSRGIYVDKYGADIFMDNALIDTLNCSTGIKERKSAHFQQYFHHIDQNYRLENVPYRYDVTGDGLGPDEFMKNANSVADTSRIIDLVKNPEIPCRTVGYDPGEEAIYLTNPGNETDESLRKQHVGINTRIGFTYGKYTAHIKFPELLSEEGVWNGLTCAFWLLYQDEGPWNYRSNCADGGYIDKIHLGDTDERIEKTCYTEIDIEIVKTSKYWPKTSYGGREDYPRDDAGNNRNLIVACTNWDLACKDPELFNQGAVERRYGDLIMEHHRWNEWYKALSSKYENPHDETVGKTMCYQIDWQPERIIWRIGPDKEHLKVIGYMDQTHTKIPDNQMKAIVTQEWHDDSWWPMAPYGQNDIPYPSQDITGWVYNIEVE